MSERHEYLFDVKLAGTIRLQATSEDAALALLRNAWGDDPQVQPLTPEDPYVLISWHADDVEPELLEVDGETQ